jgi:hypothetical protein
MGAAPVRRALRVARWWKIFRRALVLGPIAIGLGVWLAARYWAGVALPFETGYGKTSVKPLPAASRKMGPELVGGATGAGGTGGEAPRSGAELILGLPPPGRDRRDGVPLPVTM